MPKVDVLTIGAATRDVFIQSKGFKNVKNPLAPDGLDACFPLGTKIDVEEITFETGGGATNAAVTFARFGFKTACSARVGNDPGGREIVERLKKERVDISPVQKDTKLHTGYAIILLSNEGYRAILVHRGASSAIDPANTSWKALAPKWIYLTSVSGHLKTLKHVFAEAKRLKSRIAWNPGGGELALGLKRLKPFLSATDILILNREEAAELAHVPPRNLEVILRALGTFPRIALVITDGARGAYVHAHRTTMFAPPLPGERINTTGAGDAFGSGFTAAAIKTGNIEEALRAGMLNAFGVITHMGAKAGILKRFPSKKEMQKVKVKKIERT